MIRNILVTLSIMALSTAALSASDSFFNYKSIYANLGTHTEFFNAVQNDDSGGLRKFDFAPTAGIGIVFPAFGDWSYIPEFNWVLPKTYEKSRIIVNTFMYRFDMGWDPLEWLRLRIGTSIIQLNQHGRGGKAKMNNGNDTSTFYYPSENRSSLNNTLDFGLETIFDQYAVRLQTYTYSIFIKEHRQLSYTLLFTYYWKN